MMPSSIRLSLLLCLIALPAMAQNVNAIRGPLSPNDNASARFLAAYPQTEQQVFVDYQPAAQPYAVASHESVVVYRPDLGPRVAATAAPAPRYDFSPAGLGTRRGIELGLNLSYYDYYEPSLAVRFDGLRYGAEASGTMVFNDWFMTANGRFSYASVDYESGTTGTAKDKNDYLWEGRITGGRDFYLGNIGLSPYAGLGYRFLHNDFRGLTSTSNIGYRRESHYAYVPLGATGRFDLFGDGSRISLNGEYDYFIYGRQLTYLSDTGGAGEVPSHQQDGYGLRASLMWEKNAWAIGPFLNYWSIDDGDIHCNATPTCGFEPANTTVEYGLRATYRFGF